MLIFTSFFLPSSFFLSFFSFFLSFFPTFFFLSLIIFAFLLSCHFFFFLSLSDRLSHCFFFYLLFTFYCCQSHYLLFPLTSLSENVFFLSDNTFFLSVFLAFFHTLSSLEYALWVSSSVFDEPNAPFDPVL